MPSTTSTPKTLSYLEKWRAKQPLFELKPRNPEVSTPHWRQCQLAPRYNRASHRTNTGFSTKGAIVQGPKRQRMQRGSTNRRKCHDWMMPTERRSHFRRREMNHSRARATATRIRGPDPHATDFIHSSLPRVNYRSASPCSRGWRLIGFPSIELGNADCEARPRRRHPFNGGWACFDGRRMDEPHNG
jgi:hypothetical protein